MMSKLVRISFALALVAACGGAPAPESSIDPHILQKALLSSTNGLSLNGMSTNGMSTNGMSTNGMSTNGMSTNGMSTNGLSTTTFRNWFNLDPNYSSMVMKYVVRCGLAAGKTLSHTNAGVNYTWQGALGLSPVWASGQPIPVAEQQLISACLGAHANKYGVQMAISVRGFFASGSQLPVTSSEASSFDNDEGCYFGNLFDGTGVFTAYSYNSPMVSSGYSSLRACALNNGSLGDCFPLVATGYACQDLCTGTNSTFSLGSCSWGGIAYRPVSVRLSNSEIATCGDGVCDASESCSTCAHDCGSCH